MSPVLIFSYIYLAFGNFRLIFSLIAALKRIKNDIWVGFGYEIMLNAIFMLQYTVLNHVIVNSR